METQVRLTQTPSAVHRWWQQFCNFLACTAEEKVVETELLSPPNARPERSSNIQLTEESLASTYMVAESGTEYLNLGISVGKGAFSNVILGQRVWDRQLVAAKTGFWDVTDAYQQLVNEYEILRRLDHPNIIKPLDFINLERRLSIIVYKFCSAGNLSRRIRRKGGVPETEARLYTYQLCHALAYLHKRRIAHCDVKPANIVFEHKEQCEHAPQIPCLDTQCSLRRYKIMLIDFGMAITVPAGSDGFRYRPGGTPLYMAPEVLSADQVSLKADMWSVGVSVYYMLSGELPYDFPSIAYIHDVVNRMHAYLHTRMMSGVSRMGKHFIEKCMDMKVSARISSREALLHPWISLQSMNAEADHISLSGISKMLSCLNCQRDPSDNYRTSSRVPEVDIQDLRAVAEVYKTKANAMDTNAIVANAMVANAMVANYIPYPAPDPGPREIRLSPLHQRARYQCPAPRGIGIVQYKPTVQRVPHGRAIVAPPGQVHSGPRPREYHPRSLQAVAGCPCRAQRRRRLLPQTPLNSPRQLPLPKTPETEYI